MSDQSAWQLTSEAAKAPPPREADVVDAVRALGWSGVALPEISLVGCRLVPVVDLDVDAHNLREASGHGPQLDADTLAVWEWPESAGMAPPPALRLSGVLFRARRGWRRALREARSWRGFGPAAVLVPAGAFTDEVCRLEFAVYGIGLVPSDPAGEGPALRADDPVGAAVLPELGRSARGRRRTADRWVEETLYRHAHDHGFYPSV
ncbi:hypothetical protein ACQPWY_25810 [Pseudonocardia xinjiangensis]|uniref:hypothetical protein n=1 Tax=Pseudonocardia xinjiangensis TaxID=75289 RepID=UPI003D8B5E47